MFANPAEARIVRLVHRTVHARIRNVANPAHAYRRIHASATTYAPKVTGYPIAVIAQLTAVKSARLDKRRIRAVKYAAVTVMDGTMW